MKKGDFRVTLSVNGLAEVRYCVEQKEFLYQWIPFLYFWKHLFSFKTLSEAAGVIIDIENHIDELSTYNKK